jgi:hypothetical protein
MEKVRIRDTGREKFGSRMEKFRSVINIPDPQHPESIGSTNRVGLIPALTYLL